MKKFAFLFFLTALITLQVAAKQGTYAVIGGAGFVGSRLVDYLSLDREYPVVAYDRDPRNNSRPVVKLSAKDIPTAELQSYSTVVYLGGLTGRLLCDTHPNDTLVENVEDLANIALRMKHSQLLLFASTSSLITGWGEAQKAEDAPLYTSEFDRYEVSMAAREVNMRILSSENLATFPRAIGMRFGSVMGVSASQRTDLVHMGLTCSAFINGRMTVSHPETARGILWLEDLVRVVERFHEKASFLKRFEIFHVQSHWGTVSKIANAVASANHVHVHIKEHAPKPDGAGFSLDAKKLEAAIDFKFKGSPEVVVAHLLEHVPTMCVGRELLSRTGTESPPCVVCGSTDMMPVLDLHKQPLANDFFDTKEKALACDTFPLAIARCRVCQHTQLSHFVDRERLFRDYKYLSGTTTTLRDYFAWLAAKIVKDVRAEQGATGKTASGGLVLELACNDGTQLDEFKKFGWETFCVDPAENIAAFSRARGHNVQVGFWGEDNFVLPPPETVDVIIGQNVLAHVLDPLVFLKACASAMGANTRLYLQTSQCEMYESGQFDTVYHEHVSFFSAHSFAKLAELADLTITDFSKTPIHGISCLVTFMRKSPGAPSKHALALKAALDHEVSIGLTNDFFYIRYRGQARDMQSWMNAQLTDLYLQGFDLAGFGAAAKGMVLLHYLRSVPGRTWELSFVVDESPLKQGTFCPGTTIPVVPSSELVNRNTSKPLAVVVFPWNFAEEILKKLAEKLRATATKSVLAIIPFPQQRLVHIDIASGSVNDMLLNPTQLPNWPVPVPGSKNSPKTFAVLLFKNDASLIAHWIRHHAPIFDSVLMIDQGSSDGSADIAKAEAPSHWDMQSVSTNFNPEGVALAESKAPMGSWRMTLTPSEFLVHSNLRRMLSDLGNSSKLLRFNSFILSGAESPPEQKYKPLLLQRSEYLVESLSKKTLNMPLRDGQGPSGHFIHRVAGLRYDKDRSHIEGNSIPSDGIESAGSGFVALYGEKTVVLSEGLVKVDLRTTYATSQVAAKLGITSAMLSAHTAWYEIFHGDTPLVYETGAMNSNVENQRIEF